MTSLEDKAEEYYVNAIVKAVQFRTGMEDGYVSPSVGELGRAYINTSRGKVFVNAKGDKAPWIVFWPGGFTEIVDDSRFHEFFTKHEYEEAGGDEGGGALPF